MYVQIVLCSVKVAVISLFGFGDRFLVLIVLVSGRCLLFTFIYIFYQLFSN